MYSSKSGGLRFVLCLQLPAQELTRIKHREVGLYATTFDVPSAAPKQLSRRGDRPDIFCTAHPESAVFNSEPSPAQPSPVAKHSRTAACDTFLHITQHTPACAPASASSHPRVQHHFLALAKQGCHSFQPDRRPTQEKSLGKGSSLQHFTWIPSAPTAPYILFIRSATCTLSGSIDRPTQPTTERFPQQCASNKTGSAA